MVVFRALAAAALVAGLSISGATAEEPTQYPGNRDTWVQHHQWTQKFGVADDPQVTGSIERSVRANTEADRKRCVPSGLIFSNPPLPDWRIGDC